MSEQRSRRSRRNEGSPNAGTSAFGVPTWAGGRSQHRKRSHDEAHAAAEGGGEAPAAPIIDHPLVPAGEAEVIDTQPRLDELIRALRAAERFAYDTEFIGEHTYHPKLCVIQLATAQQLFIIDPLPPQQAPRQPPAQPSLRPLELTRFWELLADPAVEKIVHAGEQDFEPVARHLGRPPANIFDIQIAAAFIGVTYPAAQRKLAAELLGIDLHKGFTFSQWDRRPLSAVQVRYAADDVRYLHLLREKIVARLNENGNTAWAIEECQSLSNMDRYVSEPGSQRIKGGRGGGVRGWDTLTSRQLMVLGALLDWREAAAERADVPPRSLVDNGVLFEMARRSPRTLEELDGVRGLPRPTEHQYGAAIIEAVKRAHAAPLIKRPRRVRMANRDEWEARVRAAGSDVRARAAERSIHPALVASRRDVECLLRDLDAGTPLDAVTARLARGWRRELLGPALERLRKLKSDH